MATQNYPEHLYKLHQSVEVFLFHDGENQPHKNYIWGQYKWTLVYICVPKMKEIGESLHSGPKHPKLQHEVGNLSISRRDNKINLVIPILITKQNIKATSSIVIQKFEDTCQGYSFEIPFLLYMPHTSRGSQLLRSNRSLSGPKLEGVPASTHSLLSITFLVSLTGK